MRTIARVARALILIAASFMAVGGATLALPVAHLFADHHHEIVFSEETGTWAWVAPGNHHPDTAVLEAEHYGHVDHDVREAACSLRFGTKAGPPVVLMPIALLGGDRDMRRAALCRVLPDAAPDIGQPDLALLATMRV